ncbi:uncharacterized protein LOC131153730 [Malania oleifera]|uniref:uncharacterized protein LOC131153730 n=1 Tax=Malania oleifera TaxID=397392 RepID=UPI0025AE8428|nr:uncharacterized protein LOC131153730 [Malania oleifera]
MAPYEAFYGHRCRSPLYWDEASAKVKLIRERVRAAQSRHKSYADTSRRRRELEFEIEDKIFLKIASMKGVMRFGKKRKLTPRYIGSFEILERIGPVSYRVALPPALSRVHDVFHVSVLRKYMPDPSHVLNYEPLEIGDALSYEKASI